MLRLAVIVLGVLLLTVAAIVSILLQSGFALLPAAAIIVVLLAGMLFERHRYKPLVGAVPGPGWIDCGERFFDPTTGDLVAVYTQPSSGARSYVRV